MSADARLPSSRAPLQSAARLALALGALAAGPAKAEPTLSAYLASIDGAEVSFSGRIRYDSSEDTFYFYDENREPFGVFVDAGRKTRERIERARDRPGLFVSYSELCTVSGQGSVEIRGSRIFISIERVDQLGD